MAISYLKKSHKNGKFEAGRLLEVIAKKKDIPIYPKSLKHHTANGEYVRSKSEVIVADALFYNNVIYAYERKIVLENGNQFLPDFTIDCFNGNILLWEHLGMLTNQGYRKKWLFKKREYALNGFIEGENLFISKDLENGSIDGNDIYKTVSKIKTIVNSSS